MGTIKSPRILGGNPGVFTGSALFGFTGAGGQIYQGFQVGFGLGVFDNTIDISTINAALGALAGISIPFRGSLPPI